MSKEKWSRKFLAACMRNPNVVTKALVSGIEGEHLNDKYLSYIYERIRHLHSKKLEVTPDTVTSLIQQDVVSSKGFISSAIQCVEDLAALPAVEEKYTLDFIKKKRVDYETIKLVNEAIESFSKHKDTGKLRRQLSRVNAIDAGDSFESITFNNFDAWLKRKERRRLERDGFLGKKFKFRGAFEFLNELFEGGGVKEGTITTVNGPTNVGKSLMLSEFVLHAIHPDNGLNVLFVIAENMLDMTTKRLDAQALDVAYSELHDPDVHQDVGDIFFSEEVQETWGNLEVYKVRTDGFSTATIEAMIEDYISTHGVKPDFLAIDSPDHMMPITKHTQFFLNKKQVFLDIKNLTEDYEVITFVTAPSKASTEGKKKVSTGDTAGSYDIARLIDAQISYLKNEEDLLTGTRSIMLTKMRDGRMDGLVHKFNITGSLKFTKFNPSPGIKVQRIASEPQEEPEATPEEKPVEEEPKKNRFKKKYKLNRSEDA